MQEPGWIRNGTGWGVLEAFRPEGDARGVEPCSLLARAVGTAEMVEWALAVMEHSQEQQDEAFWWACRRSLKCMEILSPSSVNIEIAGESCLDRALGVLGAVGSQLDDEAEGRISWLLERRARARADARGARAVSIFAVAQMANAPSWAGFLLRSGVEPWGLDEEGFSTLDRASMNCFHDLECSAVGPQMAKELFLAMLRDPIRAKRYVKRTARMLHSKEVESRNKDEMIEALASFASVASDQAALMAVGQGEGADAEPRRRGRL